MPESFGRPGPCPRPYALGSYSAFPELAGRGARCRSQTYGPRFSALHAENDPQPNVFFDKLNTANKNLLAVTQEPGITRNQNTV